MNFSKLRHRIILLRPTDMIKNSMGETVPRYKPFKPYLSLPVQVDADKVYLSHDNDGIGFVFIFLFDAIKCLLQILKTEGAVIVCHRNHLHQRFVPICCLFQQLQSEVHHVFRRGQGQI